MNIYETIWMLAAIEELPLEHTFFKSRYFPTDDMMDVFNTSKVLADYREGKRKKGLQDLRAGACVHRPVHAPDHRPAPEARLR